jgi:hypothetical protein
MYVIADEVREAGTQVSSGAPVSATENHLNDLIERASRYFDLVAGVAPGFFEAAGATATARTFYGDGTNYLRLDKYVEGSLNATITVPDGYTVPTFIERNGYLVLTTEDAGAVISSLPPFPSWWRDGRGWWAGLPIVVTAKWGYAQTPADVKMAVIEMVINLLRETDPASLNLLDLERQPLREKMPPRVWEVAKRYREKESGVLV